nr:hypothetical protein [Chloroflexota bacterium]
MNAEALLERYGGKARQVLENVRPIAESYIDACLVLDLDAEDAEDAILALAEMEGCLSCQHSRAPRNAEEAARQKGYLPVQIRSCALGLSQDGCTARKPIIP